MAWRMLDIPEELFAIPPELSPQMQQVARECCQRLINSRIEELSAQMANVTTSFPSSHNHEFEENAAHQDHLSTTSPTKPWYFNYDALFGAFGWKQREDSSPRECIACVTECTPKRLVHLSCNHDYCSNCFNQLVGTGCEYEGSFPPKCCTRPIEGDLIASKASRSIRKQYKKRHLESSIPASERWYCAQQFCQTPIDIRVASIKKDGLQCPDCLMYTCISCKGPANRRHQCKGEAFETILSVGKKLGWKRCSKCKTMIELKDGCRHVTCRCGFQFCYVCEKTWTTCRDSHECYLQHEKESRSRARAQAADPVPAPVEAAQPRVENAAAAQAQADEAAAVAQAIEEVAAFEARERAAAAERTRVRSSMIASYFSSFRFELFGLNTFQAQLLNARHETSGVDLGRRTADWNLIWRADEIRRAILAADEGMMRDSDLLPNEYRSVIPGLDASEDDDIILVVRDRAVATQPENSGPLTQQASSGYLRTTTWNDTD